MEKNMIRGILAHDQEWGIGKDGGLPWPKNSEDLKWFKECTEHSTVVMGRKTWESLPFKLPNRDNVVVTSGDGPIGADIVGDLKSILKILPQIKTDIWIIGGAQLVESMLYYIDELWLNEVQGNYDCDTFLDKEKITEYYSEDSTEVKSFGTITRWIRD